METGGAVSDSLLRSPEGGRRGQKVCKSKAHSGEECVCFPATSHGQTGCWILLDTVSPGGLDGPRALIRQRLGAEHPDAQGSKGPGNSLAPTHDPMWDLSTPRGSNTIFLF